MVDYLLYSSIKCVNEMHDYNMFCLKFKTLFIHSHNCIKENHIVDKTKTPLYFILKIYSYFCILNLLVFTSICCR